MLSILHFVLAVLYIYQGGVSGTSPPVKGQVAKPSSSKLVNYRSMVQSETLDLELLDMAGNMLTQTQGSSEMFKGSRPLTLVRGEYSVRCCASGSSYDSVMYVEYNGVRQDVDDIINEQFDVIPGQTRQRECIIVERLDVIAKHNDQEIFCRYSDKTLLEAGITIVIPKPSIQCLTSERGSVNPEYKITCNITSSGALNCKHVRWVFGKENFLVRANGKRFHDAKKQYGVITSTCAGSDTYLTSDFILLSSGALHLITDYYLLYGYGDSLSLHAVAFPDQAYKTISACHQNNGLQMTLLLSLVVLLFV